jgi:hypothetical protein
MPRGGGISFAAPSGSEIAGRPLKNGGLMVSGKRQMPGFLPFAICDLPFRVHFSPSC